ncbi:ARM repeat-containing protein [Lindgomyces ingoldianus]|uniref:ARM repeat-containing protein n=1 Tax=Lindgomyces ingoldianus TaxID=673940 RepID=A0ACB6QTX4_9PLEO|nr:ARM repeat-containing protein [Lindgomyces ingoldianus]KAF2470325.1 ARM repeat-containing protein [Lindgomyces ingoldianus]
MSPALLAFSDWGGPRFYPHPPKAKLHRAGSSRAASMMDSGAIKPPPNAHTNGGGPGTHYTHGGTDSDLSQVLQALQAIYDPSSSNTTRRHASEYLEQAKRHPEAPSLGHTLAIDKSQPAQLRHYGLSMLEHSIKYSWEDFTVQQGEAVRNYVVDLAQNVAEEDPVYLRNKIAQLWTEIAKRSWAAEWMNMDQQLVELWRTSLHHQGVVLYILETLSEEVFNREDTTAGLRGSELGRACVEIFTPASVLTDELPSRDTNLEVRFDDEGWLKRLCVNLDWCLSQDYQNDERVRLCAVKTMNTLRAAMTWVMPKAIVAVQLIEHVCKALAVPVVPLQQASVEVLQSIYSRHHLHDDEFVELVCPMFTPGTVTLLREVYRWTLADMNINDLNDEKYVLCKKLSELASSLGNYIEQKPQLIPEGSDLPGIFGLLFDIFRNPSLVVSIPILHCWTKLLRSRIVRDSDVVTQMIGGLLATCCERLVRYEVFPEDSQDPTFLFLNEDIDTVPERHAFLGNYRRFCADIIEVLVRRTPVEAMEHILGQATTMFQNLYRDRPSFQPSNFSKHSQPVLLVDAQITVIDAGLKGYLKWLSTQGVDPQEDDRKRNIMEDSFEQWCRQLLQARFEDPEILKKVIQLMSTFSNKALPNRPAFALTFLEYILNTNVPEDPAHPQYSDAAKDVERICSLEIQKLAMNFPDNFMAVYDELERKINEIISSQKMDDRQCMAFSSFLFIIVHRNTTLDASVREERMKGILGQVKDAWRNDAFTKSLSTFQSFCGVMGMDRLPEFLSTHNFQNVQDWSEQPLDEEGQAMQAAILEHSQHLPLRLTKTLLAASIEKLRDGSAAYETAAVLWAEAIPTILPNILQLVSHAQAFNNIESNWSHLPPELQQVVRKVLTDRFWQAGISTESRDDFFARVSGSKSTYEGFASTVRGTVRQIRESSYYILYSLTRFRDFFYGIPDLPEPLSRALFGNAHALSSHHLSVLLSVSTHLIEGCPPALRKDFLPPMIQGLFRELDRKISSEWNILNRQIAQSGENDNLTDEMKNESILRQLTYSSAALVSVLLDPSRNDPPGSDSTPSHDNPMWKFIVSTGAVLEPILLFCTSMLRVRDSRSVVAVLRVLRNLIPRFRDKSAVRDFYCNDIFKNAITSLHEPYFVDCQKDLASLIAAIIHLDEDIPRSILLSLPGMGDTYRVDRRLSKLRGANRNDERLQRSIVLDLLSSVRGVSIHEQGKIERAKPKRKTAFQEQYMSVDQPPTIVRGTSPGLAGVADMFSDV